MKKINFIAVAALVATAMTTASCGTSDSANDEKNNGSAQADSTEVTVDLNVREAKGFTPASNIRYIDLDTVLYYYTYAKQESSKMQQKAMQLQQLQNNLAAQLQKRANEIQQKMQSNGYLTQESYEVDMKELNQLDQSSTQKYAKQAQSLDAEAAKVQKAIITAITNYVIDYNKEKQYDAILFKDAGIYFNPHLDITKEIIEGLNAAVTKK